MNDAVTHEELIRLLHYDPLTGVFTHKARRFGVTVGSVAGSIDPKHGYRRIKINGTLYLAQRLAWFYVNKVWPDDEIDHRDRNRDNNRIDNLRPATHGQNQCNAPAFKNNKTGIRGVHWHKQHRKYIATIQVEKKSMHLGLFRDIGQAASAYREASLRLHGEFSTHT